MDHPQAVALVKAYQRNQSPIALEKLELAFDRTLEKRASRYEPLCQSKGEAKLVAKTALKVAATRFDPDTKEISFWAYAHAHIVSALNEWALVKRAWAVARPT